jgi:single-stranded-DNA-specific exonuclease
MTARSRGNRHGKGLPGGCRARVCYYIPQRDSEGYGLNIEAITQLKRFGVSLIITVDNGFTAVGEIKYANSLGMKVVVTDHHIPMDTFPKQLR